MSYLRIRFSLVCVLFLSGCGVGLAPTTNAVPTNLAGRMMGGQQAVAGATIQLYEVGSTADGGPAVPLLTQTVTTDANGAFTITGLYTCNPSNALVYLVGTGGNPGGGVNPNLALMAALGPCNQLTASTFTLIDEVTTVAAVAAFAPFMNSYSLVGSNAGDAPNLAAAFTLANALANTTTGTSPGNVPPGYTVPSAEINTLANVISTCVNSQGGVAGSSTLCGTLFTLTTPSSAIGSPTDTIAALLNLANSPALNTLPVFLQQPPSPPFMPVLTQAPPTFQVALTPMPPTPPTPTYTLQYSASSLSFPNTALGYSSTEVVVVANSGNSAVTIGTPSIAGTNQGDFTATTTCATLQPAATCVVTVMATPGGAGLRTATLTIPSNATSSPQSIPLSVTGGSAMAGPVTISPSSLSFITTNATQDVLVENFGTTALTIGSVVSSNSAFMVVANNCGSSVPAQSLCTISVQATAAGTGTLTISDDASTGPQTISMSNSGAQSLQFNLDGNNSAQANVGSNPLQLPISGILTLPPSFYSTASFFGTNPGDFTATNCVPSTANCTSLTLTFTPQATGVRTAKFGVQGGEYVFVSGVGIGAPGVSFVSFPTVVTINVYPDLETTELVGGASLYISNMGTTTLNLSSSAVITPYPANYTLVFTEVNTSVQVVAPGCSAIPPAYGCLIKITMRQPSLSLTGLPNFLEAVDSISGGQILVPLVYGYAFNPSPNTFNFGSVQVGTTSTGITFSKSNSIDLDTISASGSGFSVDALCTAYPTCTVTFTPPAPGPFSGYVVVQDPTLGVSAGIIYLTGTGVGTGPTATLSTNSITFAARTLGTTSLPQTFTITNNGGYPLSPVISLIGAVNGNFTEVNNCPSSLAVGAFCTVSTTFAPTASGVQGASVQITSNAANSPAVVTLIGSTM